MCFSYFFKVNQIIFYKYCIWNHEVFTIEQIIFRIYLYRFDIVEENVQIIMCVLFFDSTTNTKTNFDFSCATHINSIRICSLIVSILMTNEINNINPKRIEKTWYPTITKKK